MNSVNLGLFHSPSLIYRHRLSYLNGECLIDTHTHDWIELILLESDGVVYTADQKVYKTEKNTLLFTRPGCVHSIKIEAPNYQRYDILFDDTAIPDFLTDILPKKDIIGLNGNRSVLQLFEKMDYYCKQIDGKPLERILLHLVEEVLCNIAITENQTQVADPFMKQVLEYIETHLLSQIDLDTICDTFFISKSHLHKQFIKHLNISPKKYIISRRLTLAQHAIQTGEKPTVACNNCGFSDYSSFYREYKKHFGIAPSEEKNHTIPDLILS